ncbi:hypothetical protein [Streptomyces sp. NPDC056264]|uniref:hypothetical protein n=1 Tax=Streptomyces sp. NPDC056264 TaxID=3345767 RepID=UPI003AAA66F8
MTVESPEQQTPAAEPEQQTPPADPPQEPAAPAEPAAPEEGDDVIADRAELARLRKENEELKRRPKPAHAPAPRKREPKIDPEASPAPVKRPKQRSGVSRRWFGNQDDDE